MAGKKKKKAFSSLLQKKEEEKKREVPLKGKKRGKTNFPQEREFCLSLLSRGGGKKKRRGWVW